LFLNDRDEDSALTSMAAEAAFERFMGRRPSRTRALMVAVAAAAAAGALVYKLLRSVDGDHQEGE
jgi:hypothetical protein